MFTDECVMFPKGSMLTWNNNFANYVVSGIIDLKMYYWGEPYQFWKCVDGAIHRGVMED